MIWKNHTSLRSTQSQCLNLWTSQTTSNILTVGCLNLKTTDVCFCPEVIVDEVRSLMKSSSLWRKFLIRLCSDIRFYKTFKILFLYFLLDCPLSCKIKLFGWTVSCKGFCIQWKYLYDFMFKFFIYRTGELGNFGVIVWERILIWLI